MLLAPGGTMRMFGWDYRGPMFYPAQTGAFLIVLGAAYGAGLWQSAFGWFLVGAKGVAVVFLVTEYFFVEVDPPGGILLAAGLDGLMGTLVGMALVRRQRSQAKGKDLPAR